LARRAVVAWTSQEVSLVSEVRRRGNSTRFKEIVAQIVRRVQPILISLRRSGQIGEATGTIALAAGFGGLFLAPQRDWDKVGFFLASFALLLGVLHLRTMKRRGKVGMGQAAAGLVLGFIGIMVAVLSGAVQN
jgi:hypothetical protein